MGTQKTWHEKHHATLSFGGRMDVIMMSQNRQNERDRMHAEQDYKTNKDAKHEIEALAIKLKSIEVDKLDKIIELLQEQKNNSAKKT